MSAEVTCHYLSLGEGRQVHYRRAGSGPPLLMLHPSPQHSATLLPAIAAFAEASTCIALDTPGYGLSDDWLGDAPTIRDYADVVLDVADALGMDRFYLYGAATGAQIAIEMGKHHAGRMPLVLLDSNGHIDAPERERMMRGYFPDVSPRRDGGHLLTYWDMCTGLFRAFPWNSSDPADALDLPPLPVDAVQAILLRYLDAGEGYARAYRPAFEKEDIAHLDGFAADAVMTRWEGSVVLKLADAMIAEGLPDNVRVLRAGQGLDQRYGVQLAALRDVQDRVQLADCRAPDTVTTSGEHRRWLGLLHARCGGTGDGSPIVLLHGAGQSSASWGRELPQPPSDRSWIALDLPGHGHSPAIYEPTIEKLGDAVRGAVRDLEGVEFSGVGLGGKVAALLGGSGRPFEPLSDLPDLTPRKSGAHLVEAWHFAANDPRLPPEKRSLSDPQKLHDRTVDLLRTGNAFAEFARLEA
ncbi:alpha/beta fold hydrolase [Aurantiacibacter gangjinensis]|uniref:alpha/beta fold hydrolase n=1 Tax=Aurantiacibacter gangjinensis TaxID=502682 RepID=UPI00069BC964|nr:alpha/beta hydrolase [Aurantiacibacter gangjinensis]APE28129.1 Alpha/beta hydrolase fold-1 protein [Aurantiacibacter gangjinensis]